MEIEFYNYKKFYKWVNTLDKKDRNQIYKKLMNLEDENNHNKTLINYSYKRINEYLYEIRFKESIRIYYTIKEDNIIVILLGGNKDKQSIDIKKANELLEKV